MSLACVRQGPGAVCIPEMRAPLRAAFRGFSGCPAAPGFPSCGRFWVCSVRGQQSARPRGAFGVALLGGSRGHFSCCPFKLGSFVHSGTAAVGFSRCQLPRARSVPVHRYLCHCCAPGQGSLPAFHILGKVASQSRAQGIKLKSYLQALALNPRTVPI